MTAVAFCVLAITALTASGQLSAVFGPPAGLQRDGQQIALEMARIKCEDSLSKSIIKRTGADETAASRMAEIRCGILLDGAPATVTVVTPHDI